MRDKQIGGPVATAVIVVVVLIAVGFGYFFVNKGSLGKEVEPKKYNRPGVVPEGANPNIGPFPNNTPPGQQTPATGAPPRESSPGGTP
jgi:hypothetical protein